MLLPYLIFTILTAPYINSQNWSSSLEPARVRVLWRPNRSLKVANITSSSPLTTFPPCNPNYPPTRRIPTRPWNATWNRLSQSNPSARNWRIGEAARKSIGWFWVPRLTRRNLWSRNSPLMDTKRLCRSTTSRIT